MCVCAYAKSLQSCPTLCNPIDYSMPGSSVHGILQARILQLMAISFSRIYLLDPGIETTSCLAGRFFTTEPPGKSFEVSNIPKMHTPHQYTLYTYKASFSEISIFFSNLPYYLFSREEFPCVMTWILDPALQLMGNIPQSISLLPSGFQFSPLWKKGLE